MVIYREAAMYKDSDGENRSHENRNTNITPEYKPTYISHWFLFPNDTIEISKSPKQRNISRKHFFRAIITRKNMKYKFTL